jgi:putative ABC transport system substrate-binding protein
VFGQKLVVAKASTESEIDSAFANFVEKRVAALFVDTEPLFTDQRLEILALSAQHAAAPRSTKRESSPPLALGQLWARIIADRQLGVYAGRVLIAPDV